MTVGKLNFSGTEQQILDLLRELDSTYGGGAFALVAGPPRHRQYTSSNGKHILNVYSSGACTFQGDGDHAFRAAFLERAQSLHPDLVQDLAPPPVDGATAATLGAAQPAMSEAQTASNIAFDSTTPATSINDLLNQLPGYTSRFSSNAANGRYDFTVTHTESKRDLYLQWQPKSQQKKLYATAEPGKHYWTAGYRTSVSMLLEAFAHANPTAVFNHDGAHQDGGQQDDGAEQNDDQGDNDIDEGDNDIDEEKDAEKEE